MGFCNCSVLLCVTLCPIFFLQSERASCFALFVFLVSRDGCVAVPHDATGLSAVYDCGIS